MNSIYSDEEYARRGTELYEKKISPQIQEYDKRHYVAIDIESGDYEVDANNLVAAHKLKERHPQALIWFTRVGSKYARSFGPRGKR